jgi:hypothetical protein
VTADTRILLMFPDEREVGRVVVELHVHPSRR